MSSVYPLYTSFQRSFKALTQNVAGTSPLTLIRLHREEAIALR